MKHEIVAGIACLFLATALHAADSATASPPPAYDAALAAKVGADDYGMHKYVLVILKTGPKPMADSPERKEMFKGHFANMQRLAKEGVLAYAGPLDGVEGRRGIFILAVDGIEAAKQHVATDPVIVSGEMVAEYHAHYGSAALMLVNDLHSQVAKKQM